MPAHVRFRLMQNSDRAGHIAPGQFHTGEKHLAGSEGVETFRLPRQEDALLPMLFGGIQVVPLVVDTGQAKMRFASNRPRRLTS